MKKGICTLICFVIVVACFSQGNPNYFKTGAFAPPPLGSVKTMVDQDWKARVVEQDGIWGNYGGITGNAFFNEDWENGYIKLSNNRLIANIPLNFNIYTNEIYYFLDSLVRVIEPSVPVEEFGIPIQNTDTMTKAIFRRGFPSIDKNTDKTFYQVLVDGQICLLKLKKKNIMEQNNLPGVPPQKVFVDADFFFAFSKSENRVVSIKKSKSSIISGLPQYANLIQSTIDIEGLKPNKDADLVNLFLAINKGIKQ
ncbi:MAG: hypothetical protein JST58_15235 [Bacteroidetes bacterium]|nr:hypothetical protein [Bacteroidota bacterium]